MKSEFTLRLYFLFTLTVIAPTALSAFYLYVVAADQYHSKVAFSVRSIDSSPAASVFGMLAESSGAAADDALILFDYIKSQQMVRHLDENRRFDEIYNDERADPLFRLGEGQPIEWKTIYWNLLTLVSFNNTSRVVEVETYAFTPEGATELARGVAEASADLINRISQNARRDAVAAAEETVRGAEERLKRVRVALSTFRIAGKVVDPTEGAKIQTELIGKLEGALANELTQLNTLLSQGLSRSSAPVRVVQTRISSLRDQIEAEREKLGDDAGGSISTSVSAYEELTVEREFAENLYKASLTALSQAQAEARRSQRYLAIHIAPTTAESAIYPSRSVIVLTIFATLTLLWGIGRMIAASIVSRF